MLRKCFYYALSVSFTFQIFADIVPVVTEKGNIAFREADDGKTHFQEWIVRYLHTIDENTDFDEVMDALMSYKLGLQAKGYKIPPLHVMIHHVEQMLRQKGVEIDREMFDFLEEEFYEREEEQPHIVLSNYHDRQKLHIQLIKKSSSSKRDKKKKEEWDFRFTKKGIFGLIKCIGGALCTLVPGPVTQGVGIALIADGVKDILDDHRDAKSAEEVAEERARIDRSIQNDPL